MSAAASVPRVGVLLSRPEPALLNSRRKAREGADKVPFDMLYRRASGVVGPRWVLQGAEETVVCSGMRRRLKGQDQGELRRRTPQSGAVFEART